MAEAAAGATEPTPSSHDRQVSPDKQRAAPDREETEMLVNGKWSANWQPVQAKDEKGFVRQLSTFRNWITPDGAPGPTGEGGFKAEPGRYHLYVALICPWASRTLIGRKLKG